MPDHGTRSCYQQGCPCTPCKAAEATYRRDLRTLKATGKQPLGARVSATETRRKIRQLQTEGLKKRDIAQRLGLKRPILELSPDAVTVRTALRVRRLHRLLLAENPEGPTPDV